MFGDIFGRDNIDCQSREIATISALASLEGVESQLRSHFNVGLNVGLSDVQLRTLISVIAAEVDRQQADKASRLLEETLRNRHTKRSTSISAPSGAPQNAPMVRVAQSDEIQTQFAPADKSWRIHPLGQTLIVTAGTGWVPQWGGPAREMREGDVIQIPAGVKHWHGATSPTSMTHIAAKRTVTG